MDRIKIDLLKQKYNLGDAAPKQSSRFVVRALLSITIVTAITGATLSAGVGSGGDMGGFPGLSLFSTLRHLVQSSDRELKGEPDDRVNFLLMGIGGEGHDGPQLTDTIIFTSYQPSSGQVGMLSIPRDMAVPIPDRGMNKINHANAYGEMKEPGSGPLLASTVVSDVLDQPIHYYIRVDFNGFSKLIDDVGGVDVYVERGFTDSQYPILGDEDAECGTYTEVTSTDPETGETAILNAPTYGCRFEVLSFEEGWTHMDGDTALKFVRSRHGNNGEGSDFARARRQQQVILAAKEKVLSASTLLNPGRIGEILGTLQNNISTNLSAWEILRLADAFKDFDQSKIRSTVLDSAEDSPLYATSLNGAFVLLPKNDDWRPVQKIAANLFTNGAAMDGTGNGEKPVFVKVEIQNGTAVNGLAFRASQLLDQHGYEVVKIGNAVERGYQHTVIYDLSNGAKPDELKALTDFLQADVMLSATGWLMSGDVVPKEVSLEADDSAPATEPDIDFLVILGDNSANLVLN